MLALVHRRVNQTILYTLPTCSWLVTGSTGPARSFLTSSQSFTSSQGASPSRKRIRAESRPDNKQDLALLIIRKCLEESKEDVDLSNMALDGVPDDVVSLLKKEDDVILWTVDHHGITRLSCAWVLIAGSRITCSGVPIPGHMKVYRASFRQAERTHIMRKHSR